MCSCRIVLESAGLAWLVSIEVLSSKFLCLIMANNTTLLIYKAADYP
jgi:hypothetical protein